MIGNIPVFWKYTERYIQNHVLSTVPGIARESEWDGIVELWQKPGVELSRTFADEPERKPVDLDEPNFMDVPRKLRLAAEPKVIVDGPEKGIKILSLIRRPPGSSIEQFHQSWDALGEKTKACEAFRRNARRYVQNRVIPGSVRSATGHTGYDGIAELWYDSLDDARAAISAASATALRGENPSAVWIADRFIVEPAEITQLG